MKKTVFFLGILIQMNLFAVSSFLEDLNFIGNPLPEKNLKGNVKELIIDILVIDEKDGIEKKRGKRILSFDLNGNKTSEIQYSPEGKEILNCHYLYNNHKQLIQSDCQFSTMREIMDSEYEGNEVVKNKKITEEIFMPTNILPEKYVIKYDEKERIIES